jgi:hypothetical protein
MRWLVVLTVSLATLASASCDEPGSPTSPAIGMSSVSGPGSSGSATPPPATPPPPPPGGNTSLECLANRGSISALIDGTPWIATCLQAVSWGANTFSIVATNGTQTVTLGAVTPVPGSFDLTTGAAFGTVSTILTGATWTTAHNAGTGTLTLSRLDPQGATGTFSFVAPAVPSTLAIGLKIVTNGVFDVTF